MKSVYIHIPFCHDICSYCDFCKMKYKKDWADEYLESLKYEIKNKYNGEKVRTLYIGGGTPSVLDIDELNKLFEIINLFDLSELEEFTIECNIESLTNEKLILFKKNGINRLSVGVQTFNDKYIKLLNRNHTKEEVFEKIEMAKMIGFNNINVDLMYALPNETIEDLEYDVDNILRLNVEHISCYSLMIEPNTKLFIDKIKPIDEDLDYDMYRYIEKRLNNREYNHYEISNYSKIGYESKHNLVYWNNNYYYGFGLSASGYLEGYRYDNTKNLNKYNAHNYVDNIVKVSEDDRLKYELILGFRKIHGINKKEFSDKFGKNIYEVFNIKELLDNKMLNEDEDYIFISDEWIYKSNEILINFV
ncbi:MAG: radical SAM family heme chaperone HemW [Bacilli bacterium]|nr:radical SAM family heme chaperone HemW [Bacilli bacterium]